MKKADDEAAVGSLLGASKLSASYKAATFSPVGASYMQARLAADERAGRRSDFTVKSKSQDTTTENEGESESGGYGTMSSVFPSFSLSRYAQARRERAAEVTLPPGVTKPIQLIKDSGPVKVEPKVWLANERTFIKWQHISVLMGAFSLALFNQSKKSSITTSMSYIYLGIALLTAGWGYYMHRIRRDMIIARSGKDFDNILGPLIISLAIMITLITNFILKVSSIHAVLAYHQDPYTDVETSIKKLWQD